MVSACRRWAGLRPTGSVKILKYAGRNKKLVPLHGLQAAPRMVGRIRHCPAVPRGFGRGNGLCPSAGSAVRPACGIGCGRMAGMAVPAHIFCGLILRPSQLPVHFWTLRCMAGGWQESAWWRVLSMVAYYYNVAPASLFARSWPARQAVSGCNGGRFAMQSGPFGGLKRPVPQCAGGQRVVQVVPFFEIIVTL